MKNFIAELLIKLEEKEQDSKILSVQVKAQSLVLSALLDNLSVDQRKTIVTHVKHKVTSLPSSDDIPQIAEQQLAYFLNEILNDKVNN